MTADCQTVSCPELASILGVSRQQVYRLAREKSEVAGIPAIVIGRRVVFSRQQVERMLSGERKTP